MYYQNSIILRDMNQSSQMHYSSRDLAFLVTNSEWDFTQTISKIWGC